MRSTPWTLGLVVVAASLTAGCEANGWGRGIGFANDEPEPRPAHDGAPRDPWYGITEAVAVVHASKGSRVHGTVRFTQTGNAVRVVADISGLSPHARHAFHIHEFGDCTASDATSAGSHYNPDNHPHAGPDTEMRHAGDLGNVETDGSGRARYDRTFYDISIAGPQNPIVGRSVIVHAAPDDFTTQPTGNAGDRIGCGVIGVAKSR